MLFTILLLALTLVIGSGAGTAASTKSWLTIGGHRLGQPAELAKLTVVLMLAQGARRSIARPPKSLLDLWKPALVVGDPVAAHHGAAATSAPASCSSGSSSRCCSGPACAWPLLLLIASPAISLILAFSTGLWGAWFLLLLALVLWYKPYLVEGIVLVVLNVVMGVVAPLLWEQARAVPAESAARSSSIHQSIRAASGYHVIQSTGRDRLGRLVRQGLSRSARRSGSRFSPSSTPTSSSPSSARSSASSA